MSSHEPILDALAFALPIVIGAAGVICYRVSRANAQRDARRAAIALARRPQNTSSGMAAAGLQSSPPA